MWIWSLTAAAAQPLEAGRYGLYLKTATRSHVPVLGALPGASIAWALLDVAPDGEGRWSLTQSACAVHMEGAGERASVRLGPGFVEAMGTSHHALSLVPAAGGWAVTIELEPTFVGFDPAVTGGAIPQHRDAPGVLDFEGDGEPGATVIVEVPMFGASEIYIAQHARSSLTGTLTADGLLSGSVRSLTLQQETLASTSPLMGMSPRMSLDAERSAWWMRPVAPDTTCASLQQRMCAGEAREGC